MQSDWNIKGRSHQCSKTGREFEEGEFFYTLLFRDEGGYRREDLCEQAWDERNDNIQPFSFWRSRHEAPPAAPAETLRKEDAEDLLRRLIGEQDPAHANARYILALMLERKRRLRPIESGDPDTLVYEHVGSGETFVIQNPHLGFDQIPAVQREVSALLGEGVAADNPA